MKYVYMFIKIIYIDKNNILEIIITGGGGGGGVHVIGTYELSPVIW